MRFLQTYIILAVVFLVAVLFSFELVQFWMKPLLLLPLIAAVITSQFLQFKQLLLAALVFSWIGDIVLLFAYKGPIYFIAGLISFLTAHILYIILFWKRSALPERIAKRQNLLYGILAVVIYLTTMLVILLPGVGSLAVPVTIYSITISLMLIFAYRLSLQLKSAGGNLIVSGALSFVISDSLLAINKFHSPIFMASFFIMITYLTAQFLIVKGALKMG